MKERIEEEKHRTLQVDQWSHSLSESTNTIHASESGLITRNNSSYQWVVPVPQPPPHTGLNQALAPQFARLDGPRKCQ